MMKIMISEQQFDSVFLGTKVMVYYNLHKETFSIVHQNKLIMYADMVKLRDVEFRVRNSGKERARIEKYKNVHAFVVGYLEDFCEYPCDNFDKPKGIVVTYNPYEYDSFVIKNTEEPIFNASKVVLVNLKDKIYLTKL